MKRTLLILACVVPLLSATQNLLHADTRFDNFSNRHKLARQYCMSVITDSLGYVWAFADGVYRFDGVRVKHYINYNNQQHGLRDNYVEHPVVDRRGRIWIGSAAGLCYYDAAADRFVYVYPDTNAPPDPAYSAAILGNELFFRNSRGICRLNLETLRITPTSLKVVSTWYSFPTREGELVVADDVYYHVYNPQTDKYTSFGLEMNGLVVRVKEIVYARGRYWMATNKGLWQTPTLAQKAIPVAGTQHIGIRSLALLPATGDSLLWLGTAGIGLQVYSIPQNTLVHGFLNDPLNPYSIASNNIISLHADKTGRLWIGSETGVSLLNPQNQYIRNHLLPAENAQSTYRFVYNFIPDRTDSNLIWVNEHGRGLVLYHWPQKKILETYPVTAPNEAPLYHRSFQCAVQLKGETWALGNIDRLVIWNRKTGMQRIINRFGLPPDLPQLQFGKLLAIGDTVYMCTNAGFLRYINGKPEAETIFLNRREKEYTSENLTRGFFDEKRRIFWLGSYNGLVAWNPATGERRVFRVREGDTVNRNVLFNLNLSHNGEIYCSSRSSVNIFNPATGTFRVIDRFGNFRTPQCFAVLEENDHWFVGTNAGLLQYFPATGETRVVNSGSPFTVDYAVFPLERVKQEIALPLTESFLYFDPREIRATEMPSPALIEEINVNGKKINDLSIVLNRNRNNLEFSFTAFDYNNPENIRFRYRLLPRYKEWIEAPAGIRNAYFPGLPPGHYVFEVQSGNRQQNWNENIARFSFYIQPAFWQTAWFRLLLLVFIAALLFMLYRRRIGQLRKKQQQQQLVQQLQVEQYKQQLELEQVAAFFSGSLLEKNDTTDVLNDVARNLIGKLGFEDCMIYLWNADKTRLLQYAGYGQKGAIENRSDADKYHITAGTGIVGATVAARKPLLVNDTSADPRYRHVDGIRRFSELCVPLIHNDEVMGAINIEHSQKNFFTQRHLQTVTTIATLVASKIKAIESAQSLYHKELELSLASRQLAETELAMLRSQMNPHFIFNSLNSIQKYIWENREEDAAEYLARFAKLMRAILENSRHEWITLEQEMSCLKLYVDLEHRRSNGNFDYTIKLAEPIQPETLLVPPLLLQPFIENAIWHGLNKKQERGRLFISIAQQNGALVCVVDDDGVGRTATTVTGVTGKKSLGIVITRQRIERLMQETQRNADIHIHDKMENGQPAGTTVTLTLPYKRTDHA